MSKSKRPAWAERCLTRADELDALADWALNCGEASNACEEKARAKFRDDLSTHLECAREAACNDRRFLRWGAPLDTTRSRLDAAEAELLNLAPADYLAGQLPSIVNHVARHLGPTDPRRLEVERINERVKAAASLMDPTRRNGAGVAADEECRQRIASVVKSGRVSLVSAVRGASSAALREQTRVRSFRNAVVASAFGMLIVAVGLVVLGAISPTTVPLCFTPLEANEVTIVCPTQQSGPIGPGEPAGSVSATEINEVTDTTAGPFDIAIVVIVGTTAAAVSAAAAIRRIRGSSEPYGVPLSLAVLKLPTGAVTAVLGLVLMRGGFVPGLSALDTSAQIVAWAAIFGYAQQLFTRLVDQQAHTVLDSVRAGNGNAQAKGKATG